MGSGLDLTALFLAKKYPVLSWELFVPSTRVKFHNSCPFVSECINRHNAGHILCQVSTGMFGNSVQISVYL